MRDTLSHLEAIALARWDELQQPKSNQAAIASCDLFLADAVRASARTSQFLVKSQPPEKE